jgi:hypothetical protein
MCDEHKRGDLGVLQLAPPNPLRIDLSDLEAHLRARSVEPQQAGEAAWHCSGGSFSQPVPRLGRA